MSVGHDSPMLIPGDALRTSSERLALAPLEPQDAEALRSITDDPRITEAVSFLPSPFSLDDAQRLIAANSNGRDCFFGIRQRTDGALVGVIGAHAGTTASGGPVEIGYWIGSAFQGQGFAREAAGALIAALRRALPDAEIIAECRPGNLASWRVLEKLGFQPTGEAGVRAGRVRLHLQPGLCDRPSS